VAAFAPSVDGENRACPCVIWQCFVSLRDLQADWAVPGYFRTRQPQQQRAILQEAVEQNDTVGAPAPRRRVVSLLLLASSLSVSVYRL